MLVSRAKKSHAEAPGAEISALCASAPLREPLFEWSVGKNDIRMRTAIKRDVPDAYFKLVRNFPLRRIANAAEHARAKDIFLEFSSRKTNPGTRDYLDVLVDLIADYERRSNQAVDLGNVTAAELVRHRLHEKGISVNALAKKTGIAQSNLSEMLNGKRDWSKPAIRELTKLLNIRAERFFV